MSSLWRWYNFWKVKKTQGIPDLEKVNYSKILFLIKYLWLGDMGDSSKSWIHRMIHESTDARRVSFFGTAASPRGLGVEAGGWGVFHYLFCKRKDLQIAITEEDLARSQESCHTNCGLFATGSLHCRKHFVFDFAVYPASCWARKISWKSLALSLFVIWLSGGDIRSGHSIKLLPNCGKRRCDFVGKSWSWSIKKGMPLNPGIGWLPTRFVTIPSGSHSILPEMMERAANER